MCDSMRGWLVILIGAILINLSIFVPTFLAKENPTLFKTTQKLFSPTCHQLYNRSLCYYPKNFSIEDCNKYYNATTPKQMIVLDEKKEIIGYKFPVCSRCMSIYLGMLIMAILFPILYEPGTKYVPKGRWLILALIPIAIDGIGQLLGFWTSTNLIRMVTGFTASVVSTRYSIPILNKIFDVKLEK